MLKLKIKRFYDDGKTTLGCLTADFLNKPLYTIERPWKDNQQMVSCIPCGIYRIERHESPKFGDCFSIRNVPNRENILIHPANLASELHGCIGVGESCSDFKDIPIVIHSKKTLELLKKNIKDIAELEIV